MSIIDELAGTDEPSPDSSGPHAKGVLAELDEPDAVDSEGSDEAAHKELGEKFLAAYDAKDPIAVYNAIQDIIASGS